MKIIAILLILSCLSVAVADTLIVEGKIWPTFLSMGCKMFKQDGKHISDINELLGLLVPFHNKQIRITIEEI